jgi:hypothetical protein
MKRGNKIIAQQKNEELSLQAKLKNNYFMFAQE